MVPELVKAAVAAATERTDATITLRVPEVHQSNQLFDVWVGERHLIVKEYLKEDEWETAPAREHASLQLLQPLDIAPRPCFYDAALGPVVVYEYMDGRMWGRYHPSIEELQTLALAMAQVHQLHTDGIWLARGSEKTAAQRVVWFEQMLDHYAAWSEAVYPPGQRVVALCRPLIERAGVVLERLEQNMPPLKFCRSDPRFANVIVRPDGRFGFVDWEDAGLRDPVLEVTDLLLHPEQEDLLTQADYHAFMATYCQAMEIDAGRFSLRVEEIGLVLPLFYIVILMRYGIGLSQEKLASWQVNEMPANLRFQRYLARALSGSMIDFDPNQYTDVNFFPTS